MKNPVDPVRNSLADTQSDLINKKANDQHEDEQGKAIDHPSLPVLLRLFGFPFYLFDTVHVPIVILAMIDKSRLLSG